MRGEGPHQLVNGSVVRDKDRSVVEVLVHFHITDDSNVNQARGMFNILIKVLESFYDISPIYRFYGTVVDNRVVGNIDSDNDDIACRVRDENFSYLIRV